MRNSIPGKLVRLALASTPVVALALVAMPAAPAQTLHDALHVHGRERWRNPGVNPAFIQWSLLQNSRRPERRVDCSEYFAV